MLGNKRLSDILLFDTTFKTISTEVENGSIKFSSPGNQATQTANDQIASLVTDENQKAALITFKKTDSQIKILKRWA